jgi:hypothetical protein
MSGSCHQIETNGLTVVNNCFVLTRLENCIRAIIAEGCCNKRVVLRVGLADGQRAEIGLLTFTRIAFTSAWILPDLALIPLAPTEGIETKLKVCVFQGLNAPREEEESADDHKRAQYRHTIGIIEDLDGLGASINDCCSDGQVVRIVHVILGLDLQHQRVLSIALGFMHVRRMSVVMAGRNGRSQRHRKESENKRRAKHSLSTKQSQGETKLAFGLVLELAF